MSVSLSMRALRVGRRDGSCRASRGSRCIWVRLMDCRGGHWRSRGNDLCKLARLQRSEDHLPFATATNCRVSLLSGRFVAVLTIAGVANLSCQSFVSGVVGMRLPGHNPASGEWQDGNARAIPRRTGAVPLNCSQPKRTYDQGYCIRIQRSGLAVAYRLCQVLSRTMTRRKLFVFDPRALLSVHIVV